MKGIDELVAELSRLNSFHEQEIRINRKLIWIGWALAGSAWVLTFYHIATH